MSSFAYLFWLAYNKKVNLYQKATSNFDETWYIGSGWQMYNPSKLLMLNAHINELICIFLLISRYHIVDYSKGFHWAQRSFKTNISTYRVFSCDIHMKAWACLFCCCFFWTPCIDKNHHHISRYHWLLLMISLYPEIISKPILAFLVP